MISDAEVERIHSAVAQFSEDLLGVPMTDYLFTRFDIRAGIRDAFRAGNTEVINWCNKIKKEYEDV